MIHGTHIDKYVYSAAKPIGKGAFSQVYKALDTENDTVVAIKIIDKNTIKQPSLIPRLRDEMTLMTHLKHEHIAELLDFIEDAQHFYIVLEYCAGGDLSRLIRRGKVPEYIAKKYMKQLADVLRYLKHLNIAHRDLKPQNILLTGDLGTLKITDFNFAREMFDNDLAQTFCGSPLYMAPEIMRPPHKYSIKSDLWSVGLILYEMVYGINPFTNAVNMVDLLNKIDTTDIAYTTDIASDECNNLLKGLLDKDAQTRLSWEDFFQHAWIELDEPEFILPPPSVSNVAAASTRVTNPVTKPIDIPSRFSRDTHLLDTSHNKPSISIINNYVPIALTPPRYSRSEPVSLYRVRAQDTHREIHSFQPRSAPEPLITITDHIWKCMSGSVNIIKGAVDYVATQAAQATRN